MSNKKLTSNDIAKKLGISRTVVSLVLNGKSKDHRISDDLAKKVLEYASKHNYEPNHLAKSLRTGRTDTLGLIIADIANPFFARLARFIEIEAVRARYSVVYCSSEENVEKFDNQINTLVNRNVDGLILTPPIGSEDILRRLNEQNIPYVVIDRYFDEVPGYYFTVNNHKSAFDATRLLIESGCKNIALINVNNELLTMNHRTIGYSDALVSAGLRINPQLIKQLNFSEHTEEIVTAVTEVIENQADAILFTTNKLGITGIHTIRRLGKKIPNDISVISFDDTDAYTLNSPPITAIKQPLEKLSKEAVKILDKRIDGKENTNRPKNFFFDTEIVIRESSTKNTFSQDASSGRKKS